LADKKRAGLVQVFTGNGKGKTTAALGTVMRASGHGLKVFIVFFMKGSYEYGEHASLARLPGVESISFGFRHLVDPANVKPEEREQAALALTKGREALTSGEYDLVVLDEVNVAVGFNLISVDEVVEVIKARPPHVELILTGRYADSRILEMADLVTEMAKVKHPYDSGIMARQGIEF
jgi:cob(I)alamin adenosyltransferase